MAGRALDLGAGHDRALPGAVTVDRSPATRPDVVHDLNAFPWPFETNSFDLIQAKDVLEHVDDVVRTMEEIHRIGRPDAEIRIWTPHYSCRTAWTDPTHRHFFGYFTFDYFTTASPFGYYADCEFAIVRRRLRYRDTLKGRLTEQVANRWPEFYEEHLAWIAPAFFLELVLQVKKKA